MKNFTTNMALKDCFQKKRADETNKKEMHELSKEIKRKLKMIEKAFR